MAVCHCNRKIGLARVAQLPIAASWCPLAENLEIEISVRCRLCILKTSSEFDEVMESPKLAG